MHTIEIPEKNLMLQFPESATEFTAPQLLAFAELVLGYQTNSIDYRTLKTHMVYRFLNLSRTADLTKDENAQIAENIYIISQLIDGYFTTGRQHGKEVTQIKMDFYVQLLPHISVGNQKFYGPTDALFNTVYGEYLQLTTLLHDFTESGDEAVLNQLIATIYRPKKQNFDEIKHLPDFDGDIRTKFNPHQTESYADTLAKLPYTTKYAIFLFVASCQHFIANNSALPIGGGNTIDLTILFQKDATPNKPNSLGMVGTLYSLAETKVFGDADQVAQKGTYDVLAFLVNQTQQYNDLKQKTNATTK